MTSNILCFELQLHFIEITSSEHLLLLLFSFERHLLVLKETWLTQWLTEGPFFNISKQALNSHLLQSPGSTKLQHSSAPTPTPPHPIDGPGGPRYLANTVFKAKGSNFPMIANYAILVSK